MRAYVPSDAEAVLAINAECVPEVGEMDADKLAFFAANASFFVVAEARDFKGSAQTADVSAAEAGIVDADPTVLGFLIGLDENVASYGSNNYAWFCERFPTFGYVDRIAVTGDARSKGLGPAMYRAFEAWAIGFGKSYLTAEVNTIPDNPHSHRFHEAFGFEDSGRGNPYGDDQEVMYYSKAL